MFWLHRWGKYDHWGNASTPLVSQTFALKEMWSTCFLEIVNPCILKLFFSPTISIFTCIDNGLS